jgi:hypothetical protein
MSITYPFVDFTRKALVDVSDTPQTLINESVVCIVDKLTFTNLSSDRIFVHLYWNINTGSTPMTVQLLNYRDILPFHTQAFDEINGHYVKPGDTLTVFSAANNQLFDVVMSYRRLMELST